MNKYPQFIQDKILELHQKNWSSRMIANELDISKSGVNYWLQDYYANAEVTNEHPTITLIDIESSPTIAAVFGRFKQNIGQNAVVQEGGSLLTASWKELGKQHKVQSTTVTQEEAIAREDESLVYKLWDVVEHSDILVAHNASGFDIPLLKTRFILNGLPPMRKVKVIDSLSLVKEFKFNSNRLDSLCSALDIGRKIETHGMQLWLRCINGDMQALQEMLEYNEQDVLLLEELYNTIKPYSTRHPNLAVHYTDAKMRCNCCASTDVEPTGNTVTTNLSVFTEYRCNSCNARFKDRTSLTTKEQRKNFLSN